MYRYVLYTLDERERESREREQELKLQQISKHKNHNKEPLENSQSSIDNLQKGNQYSNG